MKNVILILIVVAAVGVSAYFWSSYSGSQPGAPIERASEADKSPAEVRELLDILKVLQTTKIDAAYLDTLAFKEFVDFSPILVEPTVKGRPNPFLPVSASNVYLATPVAGQ